MKIGITFGTYDLLHIGHINIIERAKLLCDYLVVGISSDNLNFQKKNKYPIYSQDERQKIVSSLRFVDHSFIEESLERKVEYIKKYNAFILIMGDDWQGKFDFCKPYCDVVYLPRTPKISTTEIKAEILSQNHPDNYSV